MNKKVVFWSLLATATMHNFFYPVIYAQYNAINRFRLHCFVYPQNKQQMEHNFLVSGVA